jgi:Ca2+-binding EF-hand superfamily protein
MERLGMKISDADIMEVILSVDKNFDGEIDFDEASCGICLLCTVCVAGL